MKLKSECCKKYKRKAEVCSGCPEFADLSKASRRKRLRKIRKKLRKAT